MSSTIDHHHGPRPALSGDARLELVRRYARLLGSARGEGTRFQRHGAAPRLSRTPSPAAVHARSAVRGG